VKRSQNWWTIPDLPGSARVVDLGAGGPAIPFPMGVSRIFLSSDIRRVKDVINLGGEAEVVTSIPELDCDVVLYEPHQREAKHRVFERIDGAFRNLPLGGRLYTAGRKNRGVASYVNRVEAVFGNATLIGRADRTRVYASEKRSAEPGEPPINARRTFHVEATDGESLTFASEAGVFSADRFDPGSQLLVHTLLPTSASRILDVGCGCGVIGISLAHGSPGSELIAIDCNALAVECTEENLRQNGLSDRSKATIGDLYDNVEGERFDLVVSNPPFHEGNAVAHPLIQEGRGRLAPGGRLVIVVMRPDPYLIAMRQVFSKSQILAAYGGYSVLEATA